MHDPQDTSASISFDNSNGVLPSKLGKKNFLSLFPKMGYQPVYSGTQVASDASDITALYFTSEQILLFPPSTDNPNASQLNGIEANINRAFGSQRELLTSKEWLLFPIFEEWNVTFVSRKLWVLLVYCRAENQFYLLDPTGPNRASLYEKNLEHLKTQLQTLQLSLGLTEVNPLKSCALNLQSAWNNDHTSSGHWVAYVIDLFTKGTSLEDIQQLHKRIPVIGITEVKLALSELASSPLNEQRSEEETVTPTNSTQMVPPVVQILPVEKRDYARPFNENGERVNSLLNAGESIDSVPRSTEPPQQGFGFSIDLYSQLIFAGAAAGLVALFCLASSTCILSATAATGVLGVGTVLFLVGALGKCGLFGRAPPSGDVQTEINNQMNSSL